MDGMGWDGDRYGRDWVRMGTYGIGWGGGRDRKLCRTVLEA